MISTLYETVQGIGSDGHVDENGIRLYSTGYQHFEREEQANIQAHLKWCDYCADRMKRIIQQRIKDTKTKPQGND